MGKKDKVLKEHWWVYIYVLLLMRLMRWVIIGDMVLAGNLSPLKLSCCDSGQRERAYR